MTYEQVTAHFRQLLGGLPNYTQAAEFGPSLAAALLTIEQAYNEARKRDEPAP